MLNQLCSTLKAKLETGKAAFAFWEHAGNRTQIPHAIAKCLETVEKHHENYILLDIATVLQIHNELLPGTVCPVTASAGVGVAFRSDLIRLWLIYHFGGVWFDSDSIAMRRFSFLDTLDKYDLVCASNGSRPVAAPFAAKRHSPIIALMLRRCFNIIAKMKEGQKFRYSTTSVGLLTDVVRANKSNPKIKVLGKVLCANVTCGAAKRVFLGKEANQKSYYSEQAIHYHLTNVVYKKLSDKFPDDGTFAGFLVRKSLEMPKQTFGRSKAILKRLKPNSIGVEVGVFKGVNSRNLLAGNPTLRLYMVDSWALGAERYKETKDFVAHLQKPALMRAKQTAIANVSRFNKRAKIIQKASIDAARLFKDNSLDFVFIDAEHSYEAVKEDSCAWLPKIKPGGFISGHDYGHTAFPGVKQFVDELALSLGKEVETDVDNTWFIQL